MLAHDARLTHWTVDERATLPAIVAKQVRNQVRKARRPGGPGDRFLGARKGASK